MIKLYSNDCPKCKILKQKLDDKNIKYELESNIDKLIEKGFMSLPMLEVDGEMKDFLKAITYVNNK